MKLPPIPGLHKRFCKSCETEVCIPEEVTEVIASNWFLEKKLARCPSCRAEIILTMAKGENQGTTEDAKLIDTVRKRMFDKKKIR